MKAALYVDLRALQDPDYRVRGIGRHVTALLRSRKRSHLSDCKTIGLIDPRSPKLVPETMSLVDEVTGSVNPCCDGVSSVFIDGTPMTHDPRFALRFENHPAFLRAAVVYDFIPIEWPTNFYLPTVAHRIEYVAKMARLKKFDLFFPISQYTAGRLSELLGVSGDRVRVTGASVRNCFYQFRDRSVSSRDKKEQPYFLIVIAPDVRKNPEVAVKAVCHLNLVYGRRIPLKVVGHYDDHRRRQLLSLAGHAEGMGFLEFHPNVSDEELMQLYNGAVATIVSSQMEGFSLPVVEASVCGCPVIASNCAAHLELINQNEAIFEHHDASNLSEKLEDLIQRPTLRAALIASQAHLADRFHEEEVGNRFWMAIEAQLENRRKMTIVPRRGKPHLAFISPHPPDSSDAAYYTAELLKVARNSFDCDLYTDTPRPLASGSYRDAGGVSISPLASGQYDGIISVLGNIPAQERIFQFFERNGGPCILHDVWLAQAYFERLGQEQFLKFVGELFGRAVSWQEASTWFNDPNPPSLLIDTIIERASPLVVHTVTQRDLIKRFYGVEAQVLTCCPSIVLDDDEMAVAAREQIRERLGIKPETFVITSFGAVAKAKGRDTCILAVELLHSWNIPAEFYFVGSIGSEEKDIEDIAAMYGISEFIHFGAGLASDFATREFLVGSDVAIQLRNYEFGRVSTPLVNCIASGLPCVTTADMAKSTDAPEYVSMVPDRFSPLQVAEKVADIWDNRIDRASRSERTAYLKTHNFHHYATRLLEILELS